MVEGDFFKDNWCEAKGIQLKGGFDLIYDYTVSSIDQSLTESGLWFSTLHHFLKRAIIGISATKKSN